MTGGVYVFWREGSARAEYVGSSKTVEIRVKWHANALRKGKHGNPKLQHAWNKYGEAAYHAILIEICPDDALLKREQFWMDTLKPCRNVAAWAESNMLGHKHTAKAKAAMSAAKTGKPTWNKGKRGQVSWMRGKRHSTESNAKNRAAHVGKSLSIEHRAKLSAVNTGDKNPNFGKHLSEETRSRISAANSGKPAWNLGKVHSADTRVKISAAARLREVRKRFQLAWMEPT